MIFFSPVELVREDFSMKFKSFLENGCIRMKRLWDDTQLADFKKTYNQLFEKNKLIITCESKANINGISSSLYVFQKSNTGPLSWSKKSIASNNTLFFFPLFSQTILQLFNFISQLRCFLKFHIFRIFQHLICQFWNFSNFSYNLKIYH